MISGKAREILGMAVQFEHGLEAGNSALARGAWREARAAFEAALAIEESPEALEGLGAAALGVHMVVGTKG